MCSLTGFGRKDVVEHLLQTGANVHARDDGGLIPLHNACSFGHAEVVSLLLCQGADPNARDNWNYTPLHEAAIKGKIDVCIGKSLSLIVTSPDVYFVRLQFKPLCRYSDSHSGLTFSCCAVQPLLNLHLENEYRAGSSNLLLN